MPLLPRVILLAALPWEANFSLNYQASLHARKDHMPTQVTRILGVYLSGTLVLGAPTLYVNKQKQVLSYTPV